MERLTVVTAKGAALVMGGPYESEQHARDDLMTRYKVAVGRLAAYEDTGLEPEDIKEIMNRLNERFLLLLAKEYETTPKRAMEILMAERDGQLVVLPCKVGDQVYFPVAGRWDSATIEHIEVWSTGVRFFWVQYDIGPETNELWDDGDFELDDIGKTVFLTRQEADAALEQMKGEEA